MSGPIRAEGINHDSPVMERHGGANPKEGEMKDEKGTKVSRRNFLKLSGATAAGIHREVQGEIRKAPFLAGLAGVLSAPMAGIMPTMGDNVIMPSFIVIILGGIGSFWGSVTGGLLLGIIVSLCIQFVPAVAELSMYLVMALVFLVRPRGLFGEEGLFE